MDVASADFTYNTNIVQQLSEPKLNPITKMKENVLYSTLGLLPKIPFKLIQSIHVALQKTCYFD